MKTKTGLELVSTGHDDPVFVQTVARILRATVVCYAPQDIYVVHIDNWFDHKWLSFSGCCWSQCATWLGPLLRIPAFHPHRVVSQRYYRRNVTPSGGYEASEAPPLHTDERLDPQQRPRLHRISPAGLYLWYSGRTKQVDRASLMGYFGREAEHVGWYASFLKREAWKVGMAKGIGVDEVKRFAAR